MDPERTILVVDDESDVVQALRTTLSDQGYTIQQANRWTDAIAAIQDHRPEVVLLDLYLPTVQGEALLEFIRDLDAKLPVVIVSSEIDPTKLEQLGRMGANGFVRKPFTEEDLFVVVQQILSELEGQRAKLADEEEVVLKRPPPTDRATASRASGSRASTTQDPSPKVLPGAGVERLERERPEVSTAPARRSRRRGRRDRRGLRYYLIAFFGCLIATWLLFEAKDMFSHGFFGIDIQESSEPE